MEVLERRLAKQKRASYNNKDIAKECDLIERLKAFLEEGNLAKNFECQDEDEEAFLNPEVKAVLHDAEIVDENGVATGAASLFSIRGSRAGILKNLLKNSYVGCCMAFRKELIPIICPIPNEMYMHDYWIGTAAEYMGKVCFLDKPLIGYRRHSSNVTQMTHGSIRFMIKKRIDIIRCLGLLKKRVRKVKA